MEEVEEIRHFLQLAELDNFILTVGITVKVHDIYKKRKFSQKDLLTIFSRLCKTSETNINGPALFTKLNRASKEYKIKRGTLRDHYGLETFMVPLLKDPKEKSRKRRLPSVIPEDAQTFVSEIKVLKTEKRCIQEKLNQSRRRLTERREKVNILNEKVKQLERKLQRLKSRIKKTQPVAPSKSKSDTTKLYLFEKKVKQLNEKILNIKLQNRNLKCNKYALTQKIKAFQQKKQSDTNYQQVNEAQKLEIEQVNRDINTLRKENENMQRESDYLQSLLEDNAPLEMYDSTKSSYSPDAIHCIMDLTTLGVSSGNVGPVLQRVAKFCNRAIERLPSRRTVDSINQRRLAVAHHQIAESRLESDTTLHTDETSKFGDQYMVYVKTNKDKEHLVLGLKPIPSKSASDTLLFLNKTLQSIGNTCGLPDLGGDIICSLKNTMSDRASTEKLFNTILTEYRSQLLPQIVQNYDSLSVQEQTDLKSMNNFFCGLHLLISLAENTGKSLKMLEREKLQEDIGAAKNVKTKPFIKNSESAIFRCIRTVCNLFSKAPKSANCFGPFSLYLSQRNQKNILEQFLHNRFNIVFLQQ